MSVDRQSVDRLGFEHRQRAVEEVEPGDRCSLERVPLQAKTAVSVEKQMLQSEASEGSASDGRYVVVAEIEPSKADEVGETIAGDVLDSAGAEVQLLEVTPVVAAEVLPLDDLESKRVPDEVQLSCSVGNRLRN